MTTLVSTRDVAQSEHTYTEVLLQGLAPDGGLYVPALYPKIDESFLRSIDGAPYPVVVARVKKLFVGGGIPDDVLDEMTAKAYAMETFQQDKVGVVTPLTEIQRNFYIQNLSLGPTASFKDMAMQMIGREMEYVLHEQGKTLSILGATSGDTGSAAEAALKGLNGIQICMLSPQIGMSAFQKAQMGALSGGNVLNVSVDGRFDDCQDLVKSIKSIPEFAHLGAVNSINFARICSQIPYYVAGYLQAVRHIGDVIDVAVPSGNFGNVLSAYYAKQLGLPIRNLIVATNENAVLHRVFTTGVYSLTPAQITSSPSMDISKASNYERLVFDILGRDAEKTSRYMHIFETEKLVDLQAFGVAPNALASLGFRSGSSSHAERIATIRHIYERSGKVLDPHTADGVGVALTHFDGGVGIPMLCMETALPVKFEHTIKEALGGHVPERPQRFKNIESQITSDAFTSLPASAETLMDVLRAHGFSA